MKDQDRINELNSENEELRRQVAALEKALQKNQSAAAILQIAPLGVHELDTKGRITFVNPSQEAITGYTADELVGTYAWDRIEPGPTRNSLPTYLEHLVAEQPTPTPYFAKNIRKDGEVFDVRVDWNYKRNPQGQVIGFVSIVSDVTEARRAEEALRESGERFRILFDESAVGTVVATPDGRYVHANQAFHDFLGYTESELLGKTIQSITHSEDWEATSVAIHQALTSGPRILRFEKRYLHKDGQVRWGEVSATLICDTEGKPSYFITQVLDITRRKRAEEALQKAHDELELRVEETRLNEARLEAVLQLSHMTEASLKEITDFALDQAVALTESKIGYVAFMNEDETVLTMHSWSSEVMAECAVTDKPLVYPVVTTGLWGEAVRQRKPIVTNDYSAPNPWKKGVPEGHIGLRRHMNVPIIDEGRIVIVAGVGNKEADYNESDVRQLSLLMSGMWTLIKRNRMQAELRQHRDHLEELVHERTQSLWTMLQASDHERQIISYEIHDGLAQYLAAAGMQFQAYDSLKENSPEEGKKAYDIAVGLVRQAHAESRRLISEVRPPVIDENGLEMAISHLVHEQRRHGGPQIKFDSDVQFKRLPSILENALYRIAQEALTNACKHSESKKVKVTLAQEGQDVRLEVQDWGTGFDPDSTKEGHFGVEGIRQRVRLLGGRLTIESKPDSGTLVQVVVPILEKQTEE